MLPLVIEPPEVPTVGAPTARRRRRWVLAAAFGLLVSTLLGASVVQVPYVAWAPGGATPLAGQISVRGAPAYPPKHPVAFTTVNVGPTSLLEALAGWLDDEVDVLPVQAARGRRSEEEDRRYNAQLMDTSKLTAVAVALRYLGHPVTIRTSGAVVRQVVAGSPAAAALRLDDVIVAVDSQPVDVPDGLRGLLQVGGPGAAHTLTVERPAGTSRHVEISIRTVAAPDDPTRAIVGIAELEDRFTAFDFPFAVNIDTGDVGGPSAGLAFTLAVLDELTPGELTGGHRIAVTGTMSLDGTVGPVGGGAQKAFGVRDAGYEAFLVPPDERREVQAAVGRSVRVIAVTSLDDALAAIASLGGDVGSLRHATG